MTTQIDLAAREAAFQKHLLDTVDYFAAIEDRGDLPWFRDPVKLAKLGISATDEADVRRQLWMRRYKRPAPPVGLHTDPSVIRGDDLHWSPVESDESLRSAA